MLPRLGVPRIGDSSHYNPRAAVLSAHPGRIRHRQEGTSADGAVHQGFPHFLFVI